MSDYTHVSQYANVVQVRPFDNFTVEVYFDTGHTFLLDCKPLLECLLLQRFKDIELFKKHCVILNNCLAWHLGEDRFDDFNCYGIVSEYVFENGIKI